MKRMLGLVIAVVCIAAIVSFLASKAIEAKKFEEETDFCVVLDRTTLICQTQGVIPLEPKNISAISRGTLIVKIK